MKISLITTDGTQRHPVTVREYITPGATLADYVPPTGFKAVAYDPAYDALPVANVPAYPLTTMEQLEADGVEVETGVVLGASEADVNQWTRLATLIDANHEKASKDSGLTWEQIRSAVDSAPLTVKRKDGTPWVATVGQVRAAIAAVGNAYAAAWAAS